MPVATELFTGTGGSPTRSTETECGLSQESTQQRSPATCRWAGRESAAAAHRRQLKRGLSVLVFLSAVPPAEPTPHQKPMCWPEECSCGRCAHQVASWNQCHLERPTSSRQSRSAGSCRHGTFLRLCVVFPPVRLPHGWEQKTACPHPVTAHVSSWASWLLGSPWV